MNRLQKIALFATVGTLLGALLGYLGECAGGT